MKVCDEMNGYDSAFIVGDSWNERERSLQFEYVIPTVINAQYMQRPHLNNSESVYT